MKCEGDVLWQVSLPLYFSEIVRAFGRQQPMALSSNKKISLAKFFGTVLW